MGWSGVGEDEKEQAPDQFGRANSIQCASASPRHTVWNCSIKRPLPQSAGAAAVWANQGRSRTRNPSRPSVRTRVCVTRNHSRFPGCNVVGCWRKEAVVVSGRHTSCSLQAQALVPPIRSAEIRRPTCRLEFRSPDLAGGFDPLPTLTAAIKAWLCSLACLFPQCAMCNVILEVSIVC